MRSCRQRVLDKTLRDAAALAARALSASTSLDAHDESLARALADEIDLARRIVIAVLALRHGDRVRDAVRAVDRAGGQQRALAVEALDVILSREEAAVALPLVRRDYRFEEPASAPAVGANARDPDAWVADMVDDPEQIWRSPWLTVCARHAARLGGVRPRAGGPTG